MHEPTVPVSLVLLRASVLKLSVSGARMPSMVPNMVLRPRLSSMRKKSADQKGLPGSRDMASVKAIKAKPVPSTPWSPNTRETEREAERETEREVERETKRETGRDRERDRESTAGQRERQTETVSDRE